MVDIQQNQAKMLNWSGDSLKVFVTPALCKTDISITIALEILQSCIMLSV